MILTDKIKLRDLLIFFNSADFEYRNETVRSKQIPFQINSLTPESKFIPYKMLLKKKNIKFSFWLSFLKLHIYPQFLKASSNIIVIQKFNLGSYSPNIQFLILLKEKCPLSDTIKAGFSETAIQLN